MARILVIDDSPTETHKFSEWLGKHGHHVVSASNGLDGVKRAQEIHPDLVIMDVVMPGMNGFQATRQLTRGEDTCHIPVVIVSTKDQETDRVWAERQGARAYLTKPVSEAVLMETVNTFIG